MHPKPAFNDIMLCLQGVGPFRRDSCAEKAKTTNEKHMSMCTCKHEEHVDALLLDHTSNMDLQEHDASLLDHTSNTDLWVGIVGGVSFNNYLTTAKKRVYCKETIDKKDMRCRNVDNKKKKAI
jgi:hypothetical protein